MMEPVVKINSEENNTLLFSMSGINHSLANSLRRIILSDIPTIVFRSFPHSESKVDITINTTRLNNEILKQRIGCVPIHITDSDFPYEEYVVEVDKQNNSDVIEWLTTADFKIRNVSSDKYLSESAVREIFPPDIITGDYITITRLRPKMSDNMSGEHLKFTASFDVGTAKQDGMYNVVSTAAYGATTDMVKANDVWNEKKQELTKSGLNEEEIDFQRKDWLLLDAKRIITPDSFDFTIESVGVYSNIEIVRRACDIMIDKCSSFIQLLKDDKIEIKENDNTTVDNEYIITLHNEDYTLGNALVYFLYENYYLGSKKLSFVGFKVPHPHIPNGIIRMAFEANSDKTDVIQYLTNASQDVITTFTNIRNNFKE